MYAEFYLATQEQRNESLGIEGSVYFNRIVFNLNDVEYFFEDSIDIDGDHKQATQVSVFGSLMVLLISYDEFKTLHRESQEFFIKQKQEQQQ